MDVVPFNNDEMVPVLVQPGFPGAPSRTVWNGPVTPKENLLRALGEKRCMFMPNVLDAIGMNAPILADNKARATIMDGVTEFTPDPDGEKDVFGIEWLYEPEVNGSMVRPGKPLFTDANDWESVVEFPDPDSWDWKGQAEKSREYLSNELFAYQSTIFTGFFERLISFMDFENAAVALVDEDQKDSVHELFSRLCELYMCYVDHFVDDFGVNIVELHDDWGSQKSTLVSEGTLREMILPYIKRLSDHIHSKGAFLKLHSCGKIECFVPAMIDGGVDIWMGQDFNDKKTLVAEYGDKIMIEVEVPELGEDATDEEVWNAAKEFADDYLFPGKPVELSIYSAGRANRPLMTDALYELSRIRYCGKG